MRVAGALRLRPSSAGFAQRYNPALCRIARWTRVDFDSQ